MKFLFQGNNLHYKDDGKGQVLVLLHGFIENLDIWDDFTTELRESFRLIRMDLPGHGTSDNLGAVHTMESIAEAVHSLLHQLKIKKCVMIGHSMGGYVTLSFAAKYSSMLQGFGLFHSQAMEDTPVARENRDRTISIIRENRYNFLHHFIPELFASHNRKKFSKEIKQMQSEAEKLSPESLIAASEGMKRRSSRLDVLSEAKVPVLFILGKKDQKIPFDLAIQQVSLPQHSEVLFLGNAAHMGFLEARDITLRTVRNFTETCHFLSSSSDYFAGKIPG
ncbi:MAG: alpha/beta fold hydrolase [Bacteroidetes bacterium]|nr:alpha/beta fold hydrolase [Bacteroidota bacterium]